MTAASPYVIRFAELPVSRWANGQGETVELWRTPASGDIVQRLSIAVVAAAGPFSSLPGIDRALMPLAPAGLTVRVDADIHTLAQYETLYFSGDADAASVDVRQTSRDLNLMVRRGAGRPALSAMPVGHSGQDAGAVHVGAGEAVALIALAGEPIFDGRPLSFGDAVITGGAAITVHGQGLVAVARVV